MFDLGIGGFLTSTEFIAQLASFITALFSAILGEFVFGLFGITGQ